MRSSQTLSILLKELNLTSILGKWEDQEKEAIEKSWSPSQFLSVLCEIELAERYRKRMQRFVKESNLPAGKTWSRFDFAEAKSVDRQQVEAISSYIAWVENCENLFIFGASGVGKTHMAAAIGYSLIEKGIRVKFMTATSIVQLLQKAKQALRLVDEITRLDKFKVLIIDDIGYVKKDGAEGEVLFELITHRYEAGSIIITANQPFSQWDSIFQDKAMTVAAIDRLVHHSTIIQCNEESFRQKQAMQALQGDSSKIKKAKK
jgi:DNA replication protein DnaC